MMIFTEWFQFNDSSCKIISVDPSNIFLLTKSTFLYLQMRM